VIALRAPNVRVADMAPGADDDQGVPYGMALEGLTAARLGQS
jgi:hypothetical protein